MGTASPPELSCRQCKLLVMLTDSFEASYSFHSCLETVLILKSGNTCEFQVVVDFVGFEAAHAVEKCSFTGHSSKVLCLQPLQILLLLLDLQ